MIGYTKEVFKTEDSDSYTIEIKGAKYNLSEQRYYDDETGNEDYSFSICDEKEDTVYFYNIFSNIVDSGRTCFQNIFVVDDEFLKELQKYSDKHLPAEKDIKKDELEHNLNYGKNSLEVFPLQNCKKDKTFTFESLQKEAIGYVMGNILSTNFEVAKTEEEKKNFKENISNEIENYLEERIDVRYGWEKGMFLEDFSENLDLDEFNKKKEIINKSTHLSQEKKDEKILEATEDVLDKNISKIAYKTLSRIKDFNKESLEKEFANEIKFYNEKDFKFKDELKIAKEKAFDRYREYKEDLVKYGITDKVKITSKELNQETFYKFTDEEIEKYIKDKKLVDDKKFKEHMYNQAYLERENPLGEAIEKYDSLKGVKSEVTKQLMKDYRLKNSIPFTVTLDMPNLPCSVYDSEKNELSFVANSLNEEKEALEDFKNIFLSVNGQEKWDSFDMKDIREWDNLSESLQGCTIMTKEINKDGKEETFLYKGYEDYLAKNVKNELNAMVRENPNFWKEVKDKIEKTIEEKSTKKEKEKEYVEDEREYQKEYEKHY